MDPSQPAAPVDPAAAHSGDPARESEALAMTDIPDELVQEIKVEDMTLDKKLEVLKKHNYYDNYNEGRFIDAQDTVNTWCLG